MVIAPGFILGQAFDLPEEAKDVLLRIWRLQRAFDNLLPGGGEGVFFQRGGAQPRAHCRAFQRCQQRALHPGFPGGVIRIRPAGLARQRNVFGWDGIFIQAVPACILRVERRASRPGRIRVRPGAAAAPQTPRRGWRGQRAPAVAVAQQDDEVGARADGCWQRSISPRQMFIVCWSRAASSLTPQRRSMAWKRQPCASAELAQAREDVLLQGVALGLQVAEGGADEDAEGAR